MKVPRPLIAVTALIITGLACSSSTDYGSGGGGGTPVADILIVQGDPNPFTVTLTAGTAAVKWGDNDNAAPHRILADGGTPLFNSPQLSKGQTYTFTFTAAGTFTYHCSVHPGMVGTIQVNP
jgi:plastocyanin